MLIKNISTVSVGSAHTVALRNDGTVLATGNNDYGQCNVSDWTNIVSVSANGLHTVGLRKDGTVAISGNRNAWIMNEWKDIISVSPDKMTTLEDKIKRSITIDEVKTLLINHFKKITQSTTTLDPTEYEDTDLKVALERMQNQQKRFKTCHKRRHLQRQNHPYGF